MTRALAALLLLAACTPQQRPCPPLATYTLAEQQQVAAELATLPANAVTRRVLADARTLRDQIREVCP